MNVHILSVVPLFWGTEGKEIESVLKCLSAEEKSFQRDAYIYRAGDITGRLGVVTEGSVNTVEDDVWGNRKIVESISQGQISAETYAYLKREALMVDVQASGPVKALLMDVSRILTTCSSARDFRVRLIRSLMYVLARKNLMFTREIDIIAPKPLEERVLVHLSQETIEQGNHRVTVPFNRQQMADYLLVDRSTLFSELSRIKQCGLIDYEKDQFTVHCRERPARIHFPIHQDVNMPKAWTLPFSAAGLSSTFYPICKYQELPLEKEHMFLYIENNRR